MTRPDIQKPGGTLVHDALTLGQRLGVPLTGTGITTFASLICNPQTCRKLVEVIATHAGGEIGELRYNQAVVASAKINRLCETFASVLRFYASTIRETSLVMRHVTELMAHERVSDDLDVPSLSPGTDRAMICGSAKFWKIPRQR